MKTAQEIANFVGGTLQGNTAEPIDTVGSLQRARPGALAYAEAKYLDQVETSRASCILVPSGDFRTAPSSSLITRAWRSPGSAQWLCPPIRPFEDVHPTAIVADGATLAEDVAVGAWTLIETGAADRAGHDHLPGLLHRQGLPDRERWRRLPPRGAVSRRHNRRSGYRPRRRGPRR